jgi:hypothetical protein
LHQHRCFFFSFFFSFFFFFFLATSICLHFYLPLPSLNWLPQTYVLNAVANNDCDGDTWDPARPASVQTVTMFPPVLRQDIHVDDYKPPLSISVDALYDVFLHTLPTYWLCCVCVSLLALGHFVFCMYVTETFFKVSKSVSTDIYCFADDLQVCLCTFALLSLMLCANLVHVYLSKSVCCLHVAVILFGECIPHNAGCGAFLLVACFHPLVFTKSPLHRILPKDWVQSFTKQPWCINEEEAQSFFSCIQP